jgi:hypothetical protein
VSLYSLAAWNLEFNFSIWLTKKKWNTNYNVSNVSKKSAQVYSARA